MPLSLSTPRPAASSFLQFPTGCTELLQTTLGVIPLAFTAKHHFEAATLPPKTNRKSLTILDSGGTDIIVTKPKEKALVKRHNHLIEARYRLTLQEQRLLLWLFSEIKPEDTDFKRYRVSESSWTSEKP